MHIKACIYIVVPKVISNLQPVDENEDSYQLKSKMNFKRVVAIFRFI